MLLSCLRNTRRNYRDRGRRVCVCGGGPKFRTHGARERTDVRSDDRRWRVTTHRARRLTNGPTRARSSSCRWCLAACTVAARRSVCACVRARAALPSLASVRPARRSADRPRTTRRRRAAAGARDSAASRGRRANRAAAAAAARYRIPRTRTHTDDLPSRNIIIIIIIFFMSAAAAAVAIAISKAPFRRGKKLCDDGARPPSF